MPSACLNAHERNAVAQLHTAQQLAASSAEWCCVLRCQRLASSAICRRPVPPVVGNNHGLTARMSFKSTSSASLVIVSQDTVCATQQMLVSNAATCSAPQAY